jgi:hypothetical protein
MVIRMVFMTSVRARCIAPITNTVSNTSSLVVYVSVAAETSCRVLLTGRCVGATASLGKVYRRHVTICNVKPRFQTF